MEKTFIYAGEKALPENGPMKDTIKLSNKTLLPPRYIVEIGETIIGENDVPLPEEQFRNMSFFNEDKDNHKLMLYIENGNCVKRNTSYYRLTDDGNIKDKVTAVRYGIPYKDPDASCFKETTSEPIFDAMNVSTDAKVEVHCVSDNDTDYTRDIIIDVQTHGCSALNLFDIIEDFEDDVREMAEYETDGIFFDEEENLNVLFFHNKTGEASPMCFCSMREFMQTVVSVRLIDVVNHVE